jgi:NAD(P)-dependent dehydrogenase (short-subunit alcohol dehydrogenase family)
MKSLAGEFAPQIRVNTILIGLVESGQWRRRFEARPDKSQSRTDWLGAIARDKHIPLGRLGVPDEAARAIVFPRLSGRELHHRHKPRNLRRHVALHLEPGEMQNETFRRYR